MRVPLSWLNDYVTITLGVDELAERLTMAGLEVSAIERIGVAGAELPWARDTVLIGAILEVRPHPNADRLVLADVDYGAATPHTVVTGAPNLFCYRGLGRLAEPPKSVFAREESTGLFPEDGLLTYSWDKTAQPGETVMLLRFEVLQNGRCSEWLAINSRLTPAEAYIGEQTRPLVLDFNSKDPQGGLPSLLQNYPNPYLGETVIGFHLPAAAEATLTIQDVVGRTLRVIKGSYAQGYNQVLLKASELQATGILYYTLESGGFRSTRKMVIGGD